MAGIKLEGLKELQDKLSVMKRGAVRKIATPAMNAALKIIQDGIKSQVPPKYSHLRRLIRKRINKAKTSEATGLVSGKVGAGVGKRSRRVKNNTHGMRTSKGGVGISGANIHWALMGTGQRITLETFSNRGEMRKIMFDIVRIGVNMKQWQANIEMVRIMRERIRRMAENK